MILRSKVDFPEPMLPSIERRKPNDENQVLKRGDRVKDENREIGATRGTGLA